jgi:hypothetical protein
MMIARKTVNKQNIRSRKRKFRLLFLIRQTISTKTALENIRNLLFAWPHPLRTSVHPLRARRMETARFPLLEGASAAAKR